MASILASLLPWLLLGALAGCTFLGLHLVCGGEPPAVARWARRRAGGLADRWRRTSWSRRRSARRVRVSRVDAFDTLHVQSRLGAVADEILRLECDRRIFARAARLRATHIAYDDLLAEACRMADVPLTPDAQRPDDVRTTAELELAARGWSW